MCLCASFGGLNFDKFKFCEICKNKEGKKSLQNSPFREDRNFMLSKDLSVALESIALKKTKTRAKQAFWESAAL